MKRLFSAITVFMIIVLSGCISMVSEPGTRNPDMSSTNYALASNGGKVIVSREDAKHSGSTLNNGIVSSDLWDSGEGWECLFKGQILDSVRSHFRTDESRIKSTAMGWVIVEFPEPKTVHQVVIYTLDSKKYPAYKYGVRDLYVQFQEQDDSPWFLVTQNAKSVQDKGRKIYGNKLGIIDCRFQPRLVKRVRVVVEETNDLKQLSGWGGFLYWDFEKWYPAMSRIVEGTVRLVEIEVHGTQSMDKITSSPQVIIK